MHAIAFTTYIDLVKIRTLGHCIFLMLAITTGKSIVLFKKCQQSDYFMAHRSMRPILDKKNNTDSIFFTESKHYTWIGQKIFKKTS